MRSPPTRSPRSARLLAALVATLSLGGCAGTPRRGGMYGEGRVPNGGVTGENYTDVLRALDEAAPATALTALRAASARYQAARGLERLNDGDTDGALRALRLALVHYTPEELGRGGLPAELAPLARGIVEQVSPRGDEAHALAGNRVLLALASPDRRAEGRLREIREWGEQNRRQFLSPWVYRSEMADIYKEVARIIPAPDVLRRGAEFLVGRRQAALDAAHSPPDARRRPSFEDIQVLQTALRNTPADLAILYLRIGDLQAAADQVAQLSEGSDNALARALRSIAAGEGGADRVWELAAQLERVDAAAVAGLCRVARRRYPTDGRFAQCLGLAAARDGDLGLASAHLDAAAQLSPQDATVLRAAIEASSEWLSSELANDDITPGRRAYARARGLIEQWVRRIPRQPPPVTSGELEDLAAQLELGQANLPAAQQHLERATQATPPARDAYLTLAEIAWRHREGRRAIDLLDRGLALNARPTESDATFRPLFALRAGLAARVMGDEPTARRRLTEASTALEALGRTLEGPAAGSAHLLRAAALDALGQAEAARHELDGAINAAPDSRDVAARAVTFALSRGWWTPAFEIDQAARGRLQLDRPWQVYFALWGVISARMGQVEGGDGGALDKLEEIAEGASAHSAWTVRLAQRYRGTLNRDQLMRLARSTGHRAEAFFYEAMLELAAGDLVAAERDLRTVVQTNMLRYFEYEMAWEMLARGLSTFRRGPTPTSSAATAATSAPATAPNARTAPRPRRR